MCDPLDFIKIGGMFVKNKHSPMELKSLVMEPDILNFNKLQTDSYL